jgi:hypothetical protein
MRLEVFNDPDWVARAAVTPMEMLQRLLYSDVSIRARGVRRPGMRREE